MSLVEQTPEGQYHGDAAHGHRGLELTVDTGFVVRGRLGCGNARRFQRALCPGQRFGVANHKSEMVKRLPRPILPRPRKTSERDQSGTAGPLVGHVWPKIVPRGGPRGQQQSFLPLNGCYIKNVRNWGKGGSYISSHAGRLLFRGSQVRCRGPFLWPQDCATTS